MNDQSLATQPGSARGQEEQHSFRKILKATSILGGAAGINLLISMVRSKVVAEFLGTEGMGLMGIYMSISGVAISIASLGLSMSGVRELAAACGGGDLEHVRSTRLTLRRLAWALGLGGTVVMALAAYPISQHSFSSGTHAWGVAWLSFTVLFSLVGNYWMAVIQVAGEMTRIGKLQVVGAIAAAVVSIGSFVIWREAGIVPALVLGAGVQFLAVGFWYRDLNVPQPLSSTRFSASAAQRLLTLGGVFVAVGMQTAFMAWLVRRMILANAGMTAVGIFQAAQGLSAIYANYILAAMGTDFLPRLTACAHDQRQTQQMINDQTVVALLLGLPGVVATIAFASWLVPLFYTTQFGATVPVLQVMAASNFLRLIAWPMGIGLLAKNQRWQWVASEVLCNVAQLGVLWLLLPLVGVMASAFATVALSLASLAASRYWIGRCTPFSWSREVYTIAGYGSVAIAAVLTVVQTERTFIELPAGLLILALTSFYCLRRLSTASGVTTVGIAERMLRLRSAVQDRLTKSATSRGGDG